MTGHHTVCSVYAWYKSATAAFARGRSSPVVIVHHVFVGTTVIKNGCAYSSVVGHYGKSAETFCTITDQHGGVCMIFTLNGSSYPSTSNTPNVLEDSSS